MVFSSGELASRGQTVGSSKLIGKPTRRSSTLSARPWLTAISASPFEFSYHIGCPTGTSLNVLTLGTRCPVILMAACSDTTEARTRLSLVPDSG